MSTSAQAILERLFRIAVEAAHPAHCLPAHLPDPPPPPGRLIVIAAGKAAGAMAEAAEHHYLDVHGLAPHQFAGVAVARRGYGRPTRVLPMIEAGHPVPDEAGFEAARMALRLAEAADAQDLVLVLLSGGASANLIAPVEGVTLQEKQAVTRALLRSGASIGEINTVRKHLSRIKGGRLAARAAPARVVTLAISDVPGDDPAVIGSGPTVPDPSTLAEARAIVARHALDLPKAVVDALADARNESPKPDDPVFTSGAFHLVMRPADMLTACRQAVRAADCECLMLGDDVEGEAREIARRHITMARQLQTAERRTVILSGGELTVTVKGNGKGGPNQEYALAAAIALGETGDGITVLAADTDGTDGGAGSPDDPAGAMADGATLRKAHALGLDPAHFLAENDATGFFQRVGGLLTPGPTFTNVNDFRAILVEKP